MHLADLVRRKDSSFVAQEFIEAIDAIDNGISQYSTEVAPKYRSRTDLSSRVGWLNPAWNQSVDSQTVDVRISFHLLCKNEGTQKPDRYIALTQAQFAKASALTGEEFLGRLDYYANAWLPARDIVVSAFSARTNVDPSGRIILFSQFAPWKVSDRRCFLVSGVSSSSFPTAGASFRDRGRRVDTGGCEAVLHHLPR